MSSSGLTWVNDDDDVVCSVKAMATATAKQYYNCNAKGEIAMKHKCSCYDHVVNTIKVTQQWNELNERRNMNNFTKNK